LDPTLVKKEGDHRNNYYRDLARYSPNVVALPLYTEIALDVLGIQQQHAHEYKWE
jgi:hypothetical protein